MTEWTLEEQIEDLNEFLGREEEDAFAITKLSETYRTLDGEKAVVMYVLPNEESGKPIFFGHVMVRGRPMAAQWDQKGLADPDLHSNGFDLVGLWAEPERYLRYVYIHRLDGVITTTVTEEPIKVPNLLAENKIILSRF